MSGTLTFSVRNPVTGATGTVTAPLPAIIPRPAFQFGVTVGANDSRNPSWGVTGGTPAALQKSYNVARAALGRDFGQHVKFFGSSGISKAVQMWQGSPGREPAPLLTCEPFDLAAWSAFLDTLTVPVRLCYNQEFSQWLRTATTAQAADFDTKQGQLGNLIASHPNGRLAKLQFVGQEFQERQAATAGEQPIWKRLTPRAGALVGNDCYVTTAAMLDPVKACKATVDWFRDWSAKVPGVHIAISESAPSRSFTLAQRIAFVQGMAAYLPTVDPGASYTYWATENLNEDPTHDYSLDKPGDETFAAAVAALITG